MSRPQQYGRLALACVLAVAIGFVDYITGYDVHLTGFYLIPICWASWKGGQKAGFVLSLLCTVLWVLADRMAGHPYQHPGMSYWNTLMLLAYFMTVVYLVAGVQRRNAALEAEIVERKRLEEANLRAERLALVGSFGAQLAHEVRNPLGSITLNLDLIDKEIEKLSNASAQPAEEGRALVHEMRAEVARIQGVIDDYLRFTKLRKPQRAPLRLNEFLQQKLAFMQSTFDEAKIVLRVNLDPQVVTINADAEQLWQAVLNLLRNSIEAMPRGGALTVITQCRDKQTSLSIADDGPGMSEEQLQKLFRPFFTTKVQGTGLGLPLTEQILNEHDASIEAASGAGGGSTFTIRFATNYGI